MRDIDRNEVYKQVVRQDRSLVADEATRSRGNKYFNDGRVTEVVATPTTITAKVQNPEGTEYIVTFTIKSGLLDNNCTCPDARGRWCKHTVAVAIFCCMKHESIRIQKKVSFVDVESRHANISGLGATVLDGVKLGDVIWAVENLTLVEFLQWLNRVRTERKDADPRRHCGQEARSIETGKWELM